MYDFVCDITSLIFGFNDKTVVLFPDFECTVTVDVKLLNGGFDLDATCTDVLVDGVSLRDGDDLAKAIRLKVMELADAELTDGGSLWDRVAKDQGIYVSGAGGPDAHFYVAAE